LKVNNNLRTTQSRVPSSEVNNQLWWPEYVWAYIYFLETLGLWNKSCHLAYTFILSNLVLRAYILRIGGPRKQTHYPGVTSSMLPTELQGPSPVVWVLMNQCDESQWVCETQKPHLAH
jgi:hypothetical protein